SPTLHHRDSPTFPTRRSSDLDIQIPDNNAISNVTIKKKTEVVKADEDHQDEQVEQGLESLAEQMVEPHEQVEPQKPAVPVEEPEDRKSTRLNSSHVSTSYAVF